jgi:nitrite reductase/ring-hydroxylating ferredoxin subunit
VGAAGAAVTGITDWSETDGRARRIGLSHGLLNLTGVMLFATSLALRRSGMKTAGRAVSLLGYAVAAGAAYLGGSLVYSEQIGVDHTKGAESPRDFVPILAEWELADNQPRRVEANGYRVLLVRHAGEIRAIAETCSHLGGPLAEGTLEGDTVRCPWHGSCFSLEDGSVIDGPATHPQPRFETRVRNGQIEVRAAE